MKVQLLAVLSVLTGCGVIQSPCARLIITVCDECDVSDFVDDTVCECIENDAVNNAEEWFESKGAAQFACTQTQQQTKNRYLTRDEIVACRRDLHLLKKFGDSACDELGYESGYEDYTEPDISEPIEVPEEEDTPTEDGT